MKNLQLPIQGYGSVSAAGVYDPNVPTWRVDAATGLPVYSITELPQHARIEEFAQKPALDRASLLALHAADQAVKQAGWTGEDFAVIVGCSRGPTESWEAGFSEFQATGRVAARTSPQTTLGSIGFTLGRYFGVSGLSSSLSVTCSSGFHALLHGVALLRSGMAGRVLVGGAEAPITPFTLRQLEALRVYAEVPETGHACRPFATPASGMAIGEGAAFVCLGESAGAKRGEGAEFVVDAMGFGQELGQSATGISVDGAGLQRTMRTATDGEMPDLIVAHAPGTRRGDAAEAAAIRTVFGEAAMSRVESGKWATGHTFGASGPLGLDYALRKLGEGQSALVNATGFGGNVVSVLIGKN